MPSTTAPYEVAMREDRKARIMHYPRYSVYVVEHTHPKLIWADWDRWYYSSAYSMSRQSSLARAMQSMEEAPK